jgi:hypothetical protein
VISAARRRRQRRSKAPAEIALPPPPEHGQHDEIRRLERPIADIGGRYARPYQVVDILDKWLDERLITPSQRLAADDFRQLFRIAQFDALRCPALWRVPNSSRTVKQWGVISVNAEKARRKVIAVWEALGPRDASLAFSVLGLEWPLNQWKTAYGIRIRNGGAAVMLRGVLTKLEEFDYRARPRVTPGSVSIRYPPLPVGSAYQTRPLMPQMV